MKLGLDNLREIEDRVDIFGVGLDFKKVKYSGSFRASKSKGNRSFRTYSIGRALIYGTASSFCKFEGVNKEEKTEREEEDNEVEEVEWFAGIDSSPADAIGRHRLEEDESTAFVSFVLAELPGFEPASTSPYFSDFPLIVLILTVPCTSKQQNIKTKRESVRNGCAIPLLY